MRDNRISSAVGMLNGAEFLFEEFSKHEEYSGDQRAVRCSLIMPFAVVCMIGIELALKSLITKQGLSPGKTHDLLDLYNLIELETQQRIEEVATSLGSGNVHGMLRAHRNGLQEWRYRENYKTSRVSPKAKEILRAIIHVRNENHGVEGNEKAPSSTPPPSVVDAGRRYQRMLRRGGPKSA